MSSANTRPNRDFGKLLALWALLYLGFVIYGSLVPFQYRHVPASEAWLRFSQIPYLELGAGSRADWVANILLYIPLAFLFQGALCGESKSRAVKITGIGVTLFLCGVIGLSVEFAQVYFPPRTVSRNDLIAEALGSLLGVAIWSWLGVRLLRALAAVRLGGAVAINIALWLYIIGYFAFSLFPYDFVVSSAELDAKFLAGRASWFVAAGTRCDSTIPCLSKALIEALGFLPAGILLAILGKRRGIGFAGAFSMGLIAGIAIEALQLFIVSGISQGLSVLMRGLGLAAGFGVYRGLASAPRERTAFVFKGLVVVALPLYIASACYLAGWFTSEWRDGQFALSRAGHIHWLPFYHYYYSSEAVATVSLVINGVLYGFTGVGLWIWSRTATGAGWPWVAGMLAAILAFVMEAGKLFLPSKHADPTNILIGFMAAFIAYYGCRILGRLSQDPKGAPRAAQGTRASVRSHSHAARESTSLPAATVKAAANDARPSAPRRSVKRASTQPAVMTRLFQLLILSVAVFAVVRYPFALPLGLILVAYAVLLWRFPYSWQIFLLAALPVLDLAHWTGRFFFDEFDIFVLVTLGIVLPRLVRPKEMTSPCLRWLMGAVLLSYLASFAVGVMPIAPMDENAFNNYYSQYAGARILKGLVWGIAFLVMFRGDPRPFPDKSRYLSWGMAWGLAFAAAFILWERVSFAGLFNFSNDYRVTGSFSAMHTGGAYIEAYLVAAIPFLVYLAMSARNIIAWGFSTCVFFAAVYALMVTFSRGGYAALAVVIAVSVVGFLTGSARVHDIVKRFVLVGILCVIAVMTAIPVFSGSYMQERFSTISKDFAVRMAHWSDALVIRDKDITTELIGMGLGRYPETYFWRNHEHVSPAGYRFLKEGAETFLRLSGGDSLYFEQIISITENTDYELSFDARPSKEKAAITVPICEKWMLYSFRCAWSTFELPKPGWQHVTKRFNSKDLGSGRWFAQRTVKLTLYAGGGSGTAIDVDNVRLTDNASGNIIRNGGFEEGMDHWFFATDNHLPWHIKNIGVHLLFEQGWTGLIAVGSVVLLTFCILVPALFAGQYMAATLLASVLGLLVVGMFDSLLDSPRHVLLFFLLIGLSWLHRAYARQTPKPP